MKLSLPHTLAASAFPAIRRPNLSYRKKSEA
jgi:hypothetical protein